MIYRKMKVPNSSSKNSGSSKNNGPSKNSGASKNTVVPAQKGNASTITSPSNTIEFSISSYNNLAPFIRYFEKKGWDWSAIAAQSQMPQLTPDSTHHLVTKTLMSFISMMAKSYDENLGFNVAKQLTLESLPHSIAHAVKNSDNLSAFLSALIPAFQTLSNHVVVWVENIEGRYFLCHRGNFPPSTEGQFHVEQYRTLSMIRLLQSFIEPDWVPDILWMNNNSVTNRKTFKSYVKCQSNIYTNKHFGAIALPDNFVYRTSIKTETNHTLDLTKIISSYALLPQFSIRWFSTLINMSTRTVQRYLDKQNVKFTEIKDQIRHNHAITLLAQDTDRSISDIAFSCGYTDIANFNRAFKRWEQVTAAKYRERCHS
jgi:AraC-like DNA-binding protein